MTEKNPLLGRVAPGARPGGRIKHKVKPNTQMAIKNFVEELEWRGMIHSIMPGTQEQLQKEMSTAYVGIDPTADSLHIGHLVSVMILKHFQMCGHRPIALVGGATGMIGDPSGKSQERNLLDEKTLRHNQEAIKKQLAKLLDFESDAPNAAMLVNNYDWIEGHLVPGIHPRHRQVHHRQLHDGQRLGQETVQRRGRRHVVHRVHLTSWYRASTSCTSTRR